MGDVMLSWPQVMMTCLLSLAAGFAGAYLKRVSGFIALRNRILSLETEVASIHSELAKVLALNKRISQRVALDQHRDRRHGTTPISPEPPPPGDKAAAKAYYLGGRTHSEVARLALRGGRDE